MCLLSFVYRTAKTFGKSKTVSLFSSSPLFTRKIAAIMAFLTAIFVTHLDLHFFSCRQSEFRTNHSYSRLVDKKKKTCPKLWLLKGTLPTDLGHHFQMLSNVCFWIFCVDLLFERSVHVVLCLNFSLLQINAFKLCLLTFFHEGKVPQVETTARNRG